MEKEIEKMTEVTKELDDKEEKKVYLATGRRKKAVARVRIFPGGKGRILVNGKDYRDYFFTINNIKQVQKALLLTELDKTMDIKANVRGGGIAGQSGAVSLGISRCLLERDPQLRAMLRSEDLLTRDPRAKERKKYGQKGARRKFQWTKR